MFFRRFLFSAELLEHFQTGRVSIHKYQLHTRIRMIDHCSSQLKFTDDELLYEKNSLNILYENIELLEELRKQFKKHNPKDVERRNGMQILIWSLSIANILRLWEQ